jgi:hypothetical protein
MREYVDDRGKREREQADNVAGNATAGWVRSRTRRYGKRE